MYPTWCVKDSGSGVETLRRGVETPGRGGGGGGGGTAIMWAVESVVSCLGFPLTPGLLAQPATVYCHWEWHHQQGTQTQV